MKVMLDTSACIHIIKRKPRSVLRRFEAYEPGDLGVSSVTLSELTFGVAKSANRVQNAAALQQFALPLEVAPFEERAAVAYGPMRADLERRGVPIGPLDALIAAHALSLGATLATANVKEFRRVKGLRIENWGPRSKG